IAHAQIVVEQTDTVPSGVSQPTGTIYKYISIDHTNITDSDVNNITLRFAVNNSWMSDKGLKSSDILLMRYDGSWKSLATALISVDANQTVFEATSPGLSTFAIGSLTTVVGVSGGDVGTGAEDQSGGFVTGTAGGGVVSSVSETPAIGGDNTILILEVIVIIIILVVLFLVYHYILHRDRGDYTRRYRRAKGEMRLSRSYGFRSSMKSSSKFSYKKYKRIHAPKH
ncbi:MAG: PGF-pre-PGF domain-containing protein, partial [Candidatus Aenigmatarchaeota archaeon]